MRAQPHSRRNIAIAAMGPTTGKGKGKENRPEGFLDVFWVVLGSRPCSVSGGVSGCTGTGTP